MSKKIVAKRYFCTECGEPRREPKKPCPICHKVTPCKQSEVSKLTR